MIANLILIAAIISYSSFVIVHYVKSQKKAKTNKIPQGCFCCSAYKNGMCPSHQNCSENHKK